MTKKQKIEIVSNLIAQMAHSKTISNYATHKSELIKEILTSGFNNSDLEGITSAVKIWGEDLDREFMSKLQGVEPQFSKEFISMSKLGLINLITISTLPD